jgi:hypothetical protein
MTVYALHHSVMASAEAGAAFEGDPEDVEGAAGKADEVVDPAFVEDPHAASESERATRVIRAVLRSIPPPYVVGPLENGFGGVSCLLSAQEVARGHHNHA